jgi:DNA processing protein
VVDAIGTPPDAFRVEVRARLILGALPGVGPAAVLRLTRAFGSAAAALRAPARRFNRVTGLARAHLRDDGELVAAVDNALAVADRMGMGVVALGAPDYPARLLHLTDPPPVLFVRGRSELLAGGGVAIVGSRKSTQRGRDVARRLGRALAARSIPVVSGMALGVDGAAHQGALDAEGPTVAVLGCGADRAYPRGHARIFRRILDGGLVLSEFAPGTPPLPHHFPRRNRILAALADAVVVVEAAARSGALITVEHALDLGLDVWAVPGPIDSPSCRGSNELLSDGARPLVSVDDFVRVVGQGTTPSPSPPPRPRGLEGTLLRLVGDEAVDVAILAREARTDVPRTLVALSVLEVKGWVEQLPGMRFRRAG